MAWTIFSSGQAVPASATVRSSAQRSSSHRQPSAVDSRRSRSRGGVVGVVGTAVGQAVQVGPDAEPADEVGHAGRRQEASAQVGDFLPPLLGGIGPEGVGDQGVLDAVGAIEPPG